METIMRATPTTLLPARAIAALPADSSGAYDGMRYRVLYRDGSTGATLLIMPRNRKLALPDRKLDRHIWIVDGAATLLGTRLDAGGYARVPAGTGADLDTTGTYGCTVFCVCAAPAAPPPPDPDRPGSDRGVHSGDIHRGAFGVRTRTAAVPAGRPHCPQ